MERSSRALSADLAAQGTFREQHYTTSSFVLYGMLRPARPSVPVQGRVLHVYVEGDGQAWLSARRPSRDPTPNAPVMLPLAAADPSPGPVLYLARPCQYVRGDEARLCRPEVWTAGRLSSTVIQSLNEAVDMAKARSGAERVALVGYSSGGGAVALMAARRDDVVFVGSLAGLLDHAAWTSYHKISSLRTSLNAVDVASRLRTLPQRHLTGGADTIMPPEVNAAFCREVQKGTAGAADAAGGTGSVSGPVDAGMGAGASPTAATRTKGTGRDFASGAPCLTVPGVGHDGPWERVWNYTYY